MHIDNPYSYRRALTAASWLAVLFLPNICVAQGDITMDYYAFPTTISGLEYLAVSANIYHTDGLSYNQGVCLSFTNPSGTTTDNSGDTFACPGHFNSGPAGGTVYQLYDASMAGNWSTSINYNFGDSIPTQDPPPLYQNVQKSIGFGFSATNYQFSVETQASCVYSESCGQVTPTCGTAQGFANITDGQKPCGNYWLQQFVHTHYDNGSVTCSPRGYIPPIYFSGRNNDPVGCN